MQKIIKRFNMCKKLYVCIMLILVCFVLPAMISLVVAKILRKINWIKENDLKLEL